MYFFKCIAQKMGRYNKLKFIRERVHRQLPFSLIDLSAPENYVYVQDEDPLWSGCSVCVTYNSG